MKNFLITLAIFMMFGSTFAQNIKTVKLSTENAELLKYLEKQEAERLARIDAYLVANPNTTITFKDSLNITHIYDVINGHVLYRSSYNLNEARATKTTALQPGGSLGLNLDGANMTVGVWDGGPAYDVHPEFANSTNTGSRITVIDGATVDGDSGFSSHGTHVTGTIAANGTDPNALGMAPNVNVKSYNWTNDNAEMLVAVNSAANPILLSNHSYGVPIDRDDGTQLDASFIGAYTQSASTIDNIAKNNPKYLMVMSAGNAGSTNYTGGLYAGFDKLTDDKNAKNSLIIANANPSVAEQPIFSGNYEITNLAINPSSSQGPTDDLRIKPDIAADGSSVFSTYPDNNYATLSGTSMSAPNTTGTMVLLQQYYNQVNGDYMNSSTLRGLVCHTAVDDISNTGPDPIFGWGFLDAKASAETITDALNGEAILNELTLDQGETYSVTFSAQAGDKLSTTICWTDMPGAAVANGATNNQDPRLVNDLDLRVAKDGVEYLPWKLEFSAASGFSNSKGDNIRDNIERIDIDAPSSGTYTLTVTHKGVLKGNVGGPFDPQSQDFALIVTGNNVTLGVDNNLLTNNLVVFPNPNKGEFTISFDSNLSNNEDVKVEIHDISGRIVYNKNFVNNTVQFNKTINLGGVASGIYIANISKGSHITSHKIIIE
ncbi:S8 family serine peptidase [Winogradskyella forsetii]|uniref:S8 family serine peptidase n=1 Tax=Winogradskyella forsetii TaxID=2686077 RepID=UPI0015BC17C9|nr:S8 family serine peptidase [Winogradskyella forsetii]